MNKYLILIILLTSFLSCSKSSTEDEFDEANNPVVEKLISSLTIVDNDANESITYQLNYGLNNTLTSITDGDENAFLNYDNAGALQSLSSGNDIFEILDLYHSPYDAYEIGRVVSFDDKGNPVEVQVYEDGYQSNLLFGNILYDPNPNPFFYTLKAGGAIDVLDNVDLNFNSNHPELVKARLLLPYNNIKAIILKDDDGITQYEVQISYNYDSDNYPVSANITALSPDETHHYMITYFYR